MTCSYTIYGSEIFIRVHQLVFIGHEFITLCGGMEIPCHLEFSCSSKLQIDRLKELLANKIQV